jgi:hypothetical protein
MTEPDFMRTKPPTYEVVGTQARTSLGGLMAVETHQGINGRCLIQIMDAQGLVELDAAEAFAVAEFITTHVRKRW